MTARRIPLVLAALFAALIAAADAADRALTGAEIAALLPRIVALGEDNSQVFDANGETTFSQGGKDRLGRWEVRGDRYCSLWPPSAGWTCFDLYAEGPEAGLPARLTWAGDDGKLLKKRVRRKDAQP